MADPKITTLTVKYNDNNAQKARDVKFKGDFGFKIDGEEYSVKNGKVYNKSGKEINILQLPKSTAYQFIGMSCTAESARDYTYSEKDIKQAENDQYNSIYNGGEINGVRLSDQRSRTVIGNGAGKVVDGSTECVDGVYTTKYEANDRVHISTVSIWLQ